jgi:hypothetical protein
MFTVNILRGEPMSVDWKTIESVSLRGAAMLTAIGTIVFLFIGGGWRWSHLFLVPDLLVCVTLVAGALATSRAARSILLAGFAIGVGVFSAATASYLVKGQVGIGAMVALGTCLLATGWLLGAAPKALRTLAGVPKFT